MRLWGELGNERLNLGRNTVSDEGIDMLILGVFIQTHTSVRLLLLLHSGGSY